ncbi:hypothetical protein HWV62_15709 [Athelia sp. TMB]|nr:hypothetical protein HWV62_15709 [Athelia sp. TMB]
MGPTAHIVQNLEATPQKSPSGVKAPVRRARGGRNNPQLFQNAITSSTVLTSQYPADADARTLADVGEIIDINLFYTTLAFVPVIDGHFIVERPTLTLERGIVNGRSLLSVTNAFEGRFFTPAAVANITEYIQSLFPFMTDAQVKQGARLYTSFNNTLPSTLDQAIAVRGESTFICPTYDLLRAFPGRSWKGEFAIPPGNHADDIPYYFTSMGPPYNNSDFVNSFSKSFLDMVLSGDPNIKFDTANLTPQWPTWSINATEMLFNETSAGLPDIRTISSDTGLLERCAPVRTFRSVLQGVKNIGLTTISGALDYSKAFGKAGVLSYSKPLALQSTFCIASCTKLLTAIACLQCVEQDLFSLDSPDDVAKLLPEYAHPEILIGLDGQGKAMMAPAENKISLRQMLTHSSGMGYDLDYIPRLVAWRKSKNEAPRAFDMSVRDPSCLIFEPDEEWEYGASADWAGAMAERVSGLNLSAFMQKHIWEPLSIKHLTFHVESNGMVRQHLVSVPARNPDTGRLEHSPDSIIARDRRFLALGRYDQLERRIRATQEAEFGMGGTPGSLLGIYASQIVPPDDQQSSALFTEFEKMVYLGLASTPK